MTNFPLRSVTLTAALFAAAAQAQVATFDPATFTINVPSVSVGTASFTNLRLLHVGNLVFAIQSASEQRPAMPGAAVANFDFATATLTLPALRVGDATFLDVGLRLGTTGFVIASASELPASVSAEVAAFARAVEEQTATAVPATGAARMALTDSCWAGNGRTRANFIADWDANSADYVRRDSYLIGRRVQNIQVRALRNRSNADGSNRREIDVQWDVVYRDGTTARGVTETLISGSSAGTPRCSTPQTGSNLRVLGNQQLVSFAVRGNNVRDQRYSITSGAPLSPAVMYRREIEFAISDPMGNATYAILTGPGPTNTLGGVVYPFSMKLLSPRLLRSAPELAGKPGNFLNWRDDDNFRNCRLPSGAVPVVHVVDCVADGATSNTWGWGFTATPDAAADAGFAAQGWVAGGVYRVDVYADDGWKTVNGHAGRTPIATYYDTLERLPFSFGEMTGDYPEINLGALTPAQIATNASSATPAAMALSWTRPGLAPFQPAHHLFQLWEFHQGPKIGNPGTNLYPGYRTLVRSYPGTTATSTTGFPVSPRVPDQSGKTYTEYLIYYSDPSNGNSIRSRLSFQ